MNVATLLVFHVGEKTKIKELLSSASLRTSGSFTLTSGSSIVHESPETHSSITSGFSTVLLHPTSNKLPNKRVIKSQIFFMETNI